MTMTDANRNQMLSSNGDKLKNSSRKDEQNKEPFELDNNRNASGMHDSSPQDTNHVSLVEEKRIQQADDVKRKNNIAENNPTKLQAIQNADVQIKMSNQITNDEPMETGFDNSSSVMQERHSGTVSKHADGQLQINRKQNTNGGLQGVIDKLNTNDSPIEAVNQLTNPASYTVQWKADNHGNTSVKSKDVDAEHQPSPHGDADSRQPSLINSKKHASKSILEQTVGKLKLATEARTRTSEGDTQSSDVQLQSSAPPDYLKELLERSQTKRRKCLVPKRSLPSIYSQGRQQSIEPQKSELPSVPASESANKEKSKVNNQSVDVIATSISHGTNIKPSTEDGYVISRSPLRKLAPKPNGMETGALSVAIGPTTPPTGLVIPPQAAPNQQLLSPPILGPKMITRPTVSPRLISPTTSIPQLFLPQPIPHNISMPTHRQTAPSRNPTAQFVHAQPKSPTASHWVSKHQDQPLDLCTKSATSSETSSPPLSPSELQQYNGSEPMDLSTDKPQHLPKIDRQSRQLPPSASGFWKTPPRVAMIYPNKHSVSSSPIEADTPSDKAAANSPGLDNHKVPYGFIMSPEMMKGMIQPGGLPHPYSHMSQYMSEGFPEGAILLPGAGPHYRLPRRIALQHDEPPTPERPYMCDQCGATFKRNKSLKQHVRVHLNQMSELQGQPTSASQDQSKLQLEIRPHTCIVCQRKFAHHEQLKRHMRVHREDKSFVCEQANCGKKFNDSSQLRLHMRTHSDHKPFPCPFCTLRFKYSGDVKRHVRIHTGEKPYVCGYCKMRFTQSNTLKQHERTHTGERPYHCHKCGMTFTQSGSLKYHLAHRHPPDVKTVIIASNSQTMTSQSPMVQVMNMNQRGMPLK